MRVKLIVPHIKPRAILVLHNSGIFLNTTTIVEVVVHLCCVLCSSLQSAARSRERRLEYIDSLEVENGNLLQYMGELKKELNARNIPHPPKLCDSH
jgi:hypothetical protein